MRRRPSRRKAGGQRNGALPRPRQRVPLSSWYRGGGGWREEVSGAAGKQYASEQVIPRLRPVEAEYSQGAAAGVVPQKLGITERMR